MTGFETKRAAAVILIMLAAGFALATLSMAQTRTINLAPTAFYSDSWAVVIGINDYQHPRVPKLSYAVNDARGIEQALIAQGFRRDRVITLVDRNATKEAIERLLGDELRARIGPNDRLLVFFAGHGKTDSLRSGEEEGYLIPADGDPARLFSTAISMTALRQISDRLRAKHILYIVDACYSGYALFNRAISDDLLAEMVRKPAIQILTAGRQQDQAQERGGHGVFTEVLLRGLNGDAFDSKDWMALEELGVWIKQRVYAESNRRQLPQFGNLSGEGQFVFLRGATDVAAVTPAPRPVPPPSGGTGPRALGSVAVSTTTPGVDVWLGERKVGQPRLGQELLVPNVAVGRHLLTARKGNRVWERTVDVAAADRATVRVLLEPAGVPPKLDLLTEVLGIVDKQYVTAPDFTRARLGAVRGIAAAVPQDAFKVEETSAGPALLLGYPQGDTRIVLAPHATKADIVRDAGYSAALAQDLAPSLGRGPIDQAGVKGLLRSLDAHSAYLDRDAHREIQADTGGPFAGLGIEITLQNNIVTVVSPIEGTPAFRAGLQSRDRILSIDGMPTAGMQLAEVVKRMRGRPGTTVKITVQRDTWMSPRDVEITREQIRGQSVHTRDLGSGTGYVKIRQFQEQTPADFEAALGSFVKSWAAGTGLRALILDLRGNPGGLLTAAVEVAGKLLDDGKLVVSTQGRVKEQNLRLTSHTKKPYTDLPLVLLVDGGSASVSEVVAGALKDYGRAIIVGVKTFGKGSVQTMIPLSDGSALHLTTAHYFTPKGHPIHDTGITPDIIVQADDTTPSGSPSDAQLYRALDLVKIMRIL